MKKKNLDVYYFFLIDTFSGDVGGLEHFGLNSIDLSQPKMEFQKSETLQTASEHVQRVLSLDFARRREVIDKLSQVNILCK